MDFTIKSLYHVSITDVANNQVKYLPPDTLLHFVELIDWDETHSVVKFKEFDGSWHLRKESWEIQ